MLLPPMNLPAELHRRVPPGTPGEAAAGDLLVARGPLVIMVHGLMSIDPADRDAFWIASALGEMRAAEAAEALRGWSAKG